MRRVLGVPHGCMGLMTLGEQMECPRCLAACWDCWVSPRQRVDPPLLGSREASLKYTGPLCCWAAGKPDAQVPTFMPGPHLCRGGIRREVEGKILTIPKYAPGSVWLTDFQLKVLDLSCGPGAAQGTCTGQVAPPCTLPPAAPLSFPESTVSRDEADPGRNIQEANLLGLFAMYN